MYFIIFMLLPVFGRAQPADFTVVAITPMQYQVPGVREFSITLGQIGNVTFTTAEVYWQLDGGTVNHITTTPFTLYWQNLTTAWVQDPAFKVTLTTTGKHKLKAWVRTVYPLDVNHANDTLTTDINVFSTLPKKNVLVEAFNTQDFPPYYIYQKYNDTTIGRDPDYTIVNCYYNSGESLYYPDTDAHFSIRYENTFDRFKFPFLSHQYIAYNTDTGGHIIGMEAVGQREQFFEPVQVFFKNLSYNPLTRDLKVTVAAGFFDTLKGDYRLNVFITENSVVDSQRGAPIPASHIHKNVLRARLGGFWGKAGSIPASVKSGDVWDYQFTYTVPAGYNFDSLRITGLIQKYSVDEDDRRILNSSTKNLKTALAINNTQLTPTDIQVYPNPAKDNVMVRINGNSRDYELSIADISGRIYKTIHSNGNTEIDLHTLTPGNYFLYIDDGQVVHTKKIVKE